MHKDRPRAPNQVDPVSEVRRDRLLRHAKLLGINLTALFVIDISTGPGFWAIWPGIVMATILGIEAVPLYVNGWLKCIIASTAVIVAGLTVINLITWDDYLWVLWPAGGLIVIEFIRRSVAGKMEPRN